MKFASLCLAGLCLLQVNSVAAETIETPVSRIHQLAAAKQQFEARAVTGTRELAAPVRRQIERALQVADEPVTEDNLYCSAARTAGLAPCNSSFVRFCTGAFMGRYASLPNGFGACLVHWGQS